MQTGTAPDLRQIVVYGSQCYVYRDTRKNSLAQRSQIGTIIGISDETKNAQLQRALGDEARADLAEEITSEIDAPAVPSYGMAKAKKPWARQAYGTRGATNCAQAAVSQEEPKAGEDVVSTAFDCDPQKYAEAMQSTKRDG
uniref:Mating type protein n=1 Tax=Peronospora matthiolae TaxID=2874970 RepID=A0AAV1T931_9STRA